MYDLSTTDKVLIWEMLSAWDFALLRLGCELRLRAMAYLSAKGNRHQNEERDARLASCFQSPSEPQGRDKVFSKGSN